METANGAAQGSWSASNGNWVRDFPQPPAHSRRYPNGCCVDCWAKIKPGPSAVLVADELPTTATTTGGV